jgi:hypothetical protein
MSAPPKRRICIDDFRLLLTVKCNGDDHKIGITQDGKLAFFDHVNDCLGAEESLREMGDMDSGSRCGEIHRLWKSGDRRWQLPEPIRECRDYFNEQREERRKQAVDVLDPLADMTPRQRFNQRIIDTVREQVKGCIYRRGAHDHREIIKVVSNRKEAAVDVTYDARMRTEHYGCDPVRQVTTRFRINVPLRWYLNVYKAGLSIIDNQLVLDAFPKRPDGTQVLRVIKQSRGYKLQLRTALFTKRGALRWL